MQNSNDSILLTIRCLVYNHEPYLRQCLDGFVMQKTNFRFRAVVHDDASTDGSAQIIKEYAEKYPEIIFPIYEEENQFSKGDGSLRRIINKYTMVSKYMAYCEGDDYWTDPNKLQMQVDYLESHPDVVYSCTRFKTYFQNDDRFVLAGNDYFDQEANKNKKNFEFDKVQAFGMSNWMASTLTCVIRTDAFNVDLLKDIRKRYDIHMVYTVLSQGKGVCHNIVSGVYRKNNGGIYSSRDEVGQSLFSYKLYSELYNVTGDAVLIKRLTKYYTYLLKSGNFCKPKSWVEFKIMIGFYWNTCLHGISAFIDKLRVKIGFRTMLHKILSFFVKS